MRSITSVAAAGALAAVFLCGECLGGANEDAVVVLAEAGAGQDTLAFRVLVNGATSTRVVHLVLRIPEGLEFLSWEDGDFLVSPLRIGPVVDGPSRRVLVALATTSEVPVTATSGEVGTVKFLRTAPGEAQVGVYEASLTDGDLHEEWVVRPGSLSPPAPRSDGQHEALPARYAFRSSGPNPAARGSAVMYEVPPPGGDVKITVYDVTGRAVRALVDAYRQAGYYSEVWDLTNAAGQRVAPGVYFCRMEAGEFKDTKKIVLLE